MGRLGPLLQKEMDALKRIPGTLTAYGLLVADSLIIAAALGGALWLTGQGALWLGHALPRLL